MDTKKVLVALDVGTTKVCTIIAAPKKNGFDILGLGSHPSYGLKKGSVVNIEKTILSIKESINQAKLMSGMDHIYDVTVGIAGNHIYCFNSSGVVPVKGKEITASDVERVLEAAKAVLVPSDREILHVIPQEFRVDNTSGIKDPVGMCGSRLEVYVHIVTGKTTLVQNLVKCVEEAGLHTHKLVLQPIASSSSILSLEEKELGVILLDIGGGTTDLAVWKDGSLIHSQIIPLGGNHFTNDLAIALKATHNEAEKIKLQYGTVFPDALSKKTVISVQGLAGTKGKEIELSFVTEVLAARAEELFKVVADIIKEKELSNLVTGGIVLTGGGALIRGLPELAEYIFERPAKLGLPKSIGGMSNVMQSPKYATALGLLLESEISEFSEEEHHSKITGDDAITKLSRSLKNAFKEIF